ncbi:serine hydrolase domain-containing protein [Actinomadura fulvescens]|uniref:Beta-lactamase-related domain-containing protein n=1 Tax=Actinomadura fulvescens TaxID=46160 RepID=A0ABN3QW78_9ACTN
MRLLALLFCLLVCTPVAPASAQSHPYEAIDAFVRDRMKATHTPGIAYAVVGPDGPIHQRTWGTDGRGKPVTPQTPFLWGSVAKPVTATAVMTLVQSGRLRLTDRVVDYLPDFRFGGAAHARQVTIGHLLNQTAGLPEAATFKVTDCLGSGCPTPAQRISALNGGKPLGPPGTKYAYTSANYLLLTAIVEAVTKRPYAEYLRPAVLEPAGMKGAIADIGSAKKRNLPPGHQLLWGIPSAIADGYDEHGAGYGYLGGDLNDLAAFASFQLRSGQTTDGKAVLTPGSVRLMREEGKLSSGEGSGYGLGWSINALDAPLDRALWHTGATFGYSSVLILLPEKNIALVLQQNLYGFLHNDAVMHTGFGAAKLLAGGTPSKAPSASTYYLTVWGITALALGLILATGRSALLLRRRPAASSLRRRIATAAWTLAGALPLLIAVPAMSQMSPGQMMNWVPDAFAALCVAVAAGLATITLRVTLALRTTRNRRASR